MVNRNDWCLPRPLPDPLELPDMRGGQSRNLHESPFNSLAHQSRNEFSQQPRIASQDPAVVRQVRQPQHEAMKVSAILRKQLPPGRYEKETNVPRRPPLILEESIKAFKEALVSETMEGENSLSQLKTRKKDIHRYLRVVHVIGEYIHQHNSLHEKDPFMQYRWYAEDNSCSDITNTLFSIIEDRARCIVPHLYSVYTYNDAQRRDGSNMEALVASVAEDPMFDPLTQTARVFGIRRLIQEKMASKKKSRDRREKRTYAQGLGHREVLSFPVRGPPTRTARTTNSDLPTVSNAAIAHARTLEPQRLMTISPGGVSTRLDHQGSQRHSNSRNSQSGNFMERELLKTDRRGENALRTQRTSNNARMGNVNLSQSLGAQMMASPRSNPPISNAFGGARAPLDILNRDPNTAENNVARVAERLPYTTSNVFRDNACRRDTDVRLQVEQHTTPVREDLVLPRRVQRTIPHDSLAVQHAASYMKHSELQSQDDSSSSEEDEEDGDEKTELVRLKKRLREIENRSLKRPSKKKRGRK